jgi:hypothetical protein
MSFSWDVKPTPPYQEIAYQKEIADLLLANLEVMCPESFLAGGAPRDWELGLPAKDLDLYVSLDRNMSTKAKEYILASLLGKLGGLDFLDVMHPSSHVEYSAIEGLDCVFSGVFRDQDFQIINMETQEDLAKAVGRFDTSICKIWYKGGQTHYTDEFAETMGTRVIKLSEGYTWGAKHPLKMVNRFQGFGFTFEGLAPAAPRPILPGTPAELVFDPLRPWEDLF